MRLIKLEPLDRQALRNEAPLWRRLSASRRLTGEEFKHLDGFCPFKWIGVKMSPIAPTGKNARGAGSDSGRALYTWRYRRNYSAAPQTIRRISLTVASSCRACDSAGKAFRVCGFSLS